MRTTRPPRSGDPAREGAVAVWSAWVDRLAPDDEALALLDPVVRARADRFHARLDRDRFVARRAFQRRVLGACLGIAPTDVAIHLTPGGRPSVDPSWGIDFSTSHDDGLAVIAVTSGGRVGVDIERVRHLPDALELAAAHMTPKETAWLRSRSPRTRSRTFLELWTRKEALVKALGTGLSVPLDGIDTMPGDSRGAIRPSGMPGDAAWSVVALDRPGDGGHVGSVAIEGSRVRVVLMDGPNGRMVAA
jgi:4'-phosphopantetheinyl transferase